jgi:hypothetical protein
VTIGASRDGEPRADLAGDESVQALAIPFEPGAAALIRLGVELVIEAYERDPHATLARLADVVARGDEPFAIPSELLASDEETE